MVNPTKDTIPNLIVFGHRRRNINNANLEPGQQWTALGNSQAPVPSPSNLFGKPNAFPQYGKVHLIRFHFAYSVVIDFQIEGTSSIQWG